MRELTPHEIQKLADEYKAFGRWHIVMETAKEYFIGEPHKVVVDTGSEYNDNGGSYEYIESFSVYNRDGEKLERNAAKILHGDEDPDKTEAYLDDYWSDILSDLSGVTYGTYVVTNPPKISFPKVMVEG